MPVALLYTDDPEVRCSAHAEGEPTGEVHPWDLDEDAPVVVCAVCSAVLYTRPLPAPLCSFDDGWEVREQEPMRVRLSHATGLDFEPANLGGSLFGWVATLPGGPEVIVSPDYSAGVVVEDGMGRPITYRTPTERCGWVAQVGDDTDTGNYSAGPHGADDAPFAIACTRAAIAAYRAGTV